MAYCQDYFVTPSFQELAVRGLLDTATTALLLSAVVFSQLITHFENDLGA